RYRRPGGALQAEVRTQRRQGRVGCGPRKKRQLRLPFFIPARAFLTPGGWHASLRLEVQTAATAGCGRPERALARQVPRVPGYPSAHSSGATMAAMPTTAKIDAATQRTSFIGQYRVTRSPRKTAGTLAHIMPMVVPNSTAWKSP